ncbi:MAG: hypothetical protein AMK72_02440 [Planctomycetes bacterium SM23_25]|nr:MAG: hypothetical protein AMK72_02440 [Planctomycetes bacterium SM23_25]
MATLMHQGLGTSDRAAQDGMRARAGAGAASFRRRGTLEECQSEAQEQVEALWQELEEDPGASNRRQQAVRRRAVCALAGAPAALQRLWRHLRQAAPGARLNHLLRMRR